MAENWGLSKRFSLQFKLVQGKNSFDRKISKSLKNFFGARFETTLSINPPNIKIHINLIHSPKKNSKHRNCFRVGECDTKHGRKK